MKRITEASTWAGLGVIFQAMKAAMPQHAVYLDGLTVLAGVVAGIVPEKAAPAATEQAAK
jgi:hypothetical protein